MREGALDVKKWVILLACTTLLFAGLWLYESADPFDTQRMEELCQKEAESAAEAFQNYQQFREINRNEGEYWGAASRFYAFKELVPPLYGNRWKESIYPDADGIYDFMIFRPELLFFHREKPDIAVIFCHDFALRKFRQQRQSFIEQMQGRCRLCDRTRLTDQR